MKNGEVDIKPVDATVSESALALSMYLELITPFP